MIGQLFVATSTLIQSRFVQASTAALAVPVAATTLHAVGLSSDLNATVVSSGLVDPGLWLALSIAAAFGALGGIVAELISGRGHVELPHRARRRTRSGRRLADAEHEIDLGIFGRMLVGAAAALAFLALTSPGTAASLVVNALIAGSAATGVFRLVQGRMLGKTQPTPSRSAPQHTRATLSVVNSSAPASAAVQ